MNLTDDELANHLRNLSATLHGPIGQALNDAAERIEDMACELASNEAEDEFREDLRFQNAELRRKIATLEKQAIIKKPK